MSFETIGQSFDSYDAALTALVAEFFGDSNVADVDPAAAASEIVATGWLSEFSAVYGAPAEGAVESVVAELAARG